MAWAGAKADCCDCHEERYAIMFFVLLLMVRAKYYKHD